MLHILLTILKILGIIIAVILGILLLLICILLFVPIRYEIAGKCDGTLDSARAKISATWLLHLVRADLIYKDKKLKWRVRAAWYKQIGGKDFTEKEESSEEDFFAGEVLQEEAEKASAAEQPASIADQDKKDIITTEEDYEKEEQHSQPVQEVPEKPEKVQAIEGSPQSPEKMEASVEEESSYQQENQSHEESPEKKDKEKTGGIQKVFKKIRSFVRKIKHTFQEICAKIKALLQTKDKVVCFLNDEVHQEAWRKVKKEGLKLLKALKPKKIDLKVRFGFEDPYQTGRVLAGLSVIYPWIGTMTEVIPDFEQKILKGTGLIKGRIYLCSLAKCAFMLIISKNVRKTYVHIRDFESYGSESEMRE